MTMSHELQKLEALLHSGTLTPEEFQLAKRRVLEEGSVTVEQEELDVVKAQLALVQLERNWESDQEQYLVFGRNGVKCLPTKDGGIIGLGAVVVFFCLGIFLAVAVARGRLGIWYLLRPEAILVELLFLGALIAGTCLSISELIAYNEYEKAYSHFNWRRRDLQDQIASIKSESLAD